MIRIAHMVGHRPSPSAIALAVAATLMGCDVGPDYHQPETSVPVKWDNAQAGLPDNFPSPEWWNTFGSPELNGLIAEAQRGNTDVAAAAARVREADATAQVAGAPLLPWLEADTYVGPERQYNLTGHERHHVLYQGALQASYEIDFWGKNRSALNAALSRADASRFAQQVVWLSTSAGVANLYFQFLGLQDQLKVARDNLARAQHTLNDFMQEQRQGIIPELGVVQQQSVVASLVAAIPPLQQSLATTKSALAVLVGKLPESLVLGAGSLLDLRYPAIGQGVPSELLVRRPDVQEAEAKLKAANGDIRVARAAMLPSFDFSLTYGLTSMTLSPPQNTLPPLATYSFLQNITAPIFQGGLLKGQLEQSKAKYQEALVGDYRKAVLTAFGDVENALSAVRTTAAEEAAQRSHVSAAQRSSGMASESLRGGTGTVLDVLTSETTVYSAQDGLVQARLAHLQALVGLTQALGGGWKS
jgi:outer membrane protein, multidrug efflux system